MKTQIHPGQIWIYKQSLRPYKIIKTINGNVYYTPASLSPRYGDIFERTLSEFLDKFVTPDLVTDEIQKAAIENTLKGLGIIGESK